jgi:hypothetical protein
VVEDEATVGDNFVPADHELGFEHGHLSPIHINSISIISQSDLVRFIRQEKGASDRFADIFNSPIEAISSFSRAKATDDRLMAILDTNSALQGP